MRAEEERISVRFELSETDMADGIRLGKDVNRTIRTTHPEDSSWTMNSMVGWGLVPRLFSDIVDFSKAKVAKNDEYSNAEFLLKSGVTEIARGGWETFLNTDLNGYTDVTVVISTTYDKVGVDGTTEDGIDDRLQTTYSVHVETGIDSNLYEPATSYTVNNTDDLAKLVASGDYVNLPGLYDEKYDSDDNEYVLVYTIDGDDIYANWELASKVKDRFTAVSSNDKDTNGDGKVSCDEYYGTTGLEWSDKLNACVVSSTGDAVVTIPNTATK